MFVLDQLYSLIEEEFINNLRVFYVDTALLLRPDLGIFINAKNINVELNKLYIIYIPHLECKF